jgi:hypothetical protein
MKQTPEELKREFAEKQFPTVDSFAETSMFNIAQRHAQDNCLSDLHALLDKLKNIKREKTPGIDDFADRVDEIFEQGNPTKAQIYDAYNKAVDKLMPTDEADRWDAEEYLNTKDIWNHPMVSDRTNKNGYEVADLMAEFTNQWFRSRMKGK